MRAAGIRACRDAWEGLFRRVALKGASTPRDAGVITEDNAGRIKDIARSFSPELRSSIPPPAE